MTFEEFRKEYSGFDWDNGEIVFTFKDNIKVIIWSEKNNPYRTIARKYFKYYVVANWAYTQNVMVVVLHKNERKEKMTKQEKEAKRIILLNRIFDEEKRRTKIEQDAERLHIAGHPDKAAKVLNELDDSIIIELREKLKKLDEEPAAEAEGVDPETRARILRLCEKDPRITHGNLIFEQDVKAREMTKKAITTLFEMEPLTVEKAVLILEDAADILKEAAAKRTF